MANCGLMTNKAFTFTKALIKNDSICFLDLGHNNFASDDYSIASCLGTMIKTHYYLLHVDLSHCKMSIEETMYIGLCIKASNQLMSLHLTGNTCHVYGRAFVRTLLDSEPQYPLRRRQDIDSYITEGDTTLLMIFSNFYKQRIMPGEIYEFFVNDKTEVRELEVSTCLDYIKIIEKKIEESKVRLKDVKRPRIHFEDENSKENESICNINVYPDTNPLIRIYQDYMISYLKNLQRVKNIDDKEITKKKAVTHEELRRDLFQRRKKRQKFRDFNQEREKDKKEVQKILAAPIPIDRSLLLNDQKMSRRQTKFSDKLKEFGFTASEKGDGTITESGVDGAHNTSQSHRRHAPLKALKFLSQPNGPMSDFKREIVFTRVLQK